MSKSLADFVKDLQQSAVRLEPLGGSVERAGGLGEHQGIGAPRALQSIFDVAAMPANHADQMLTHVFAGRDSSDLAGGIGQKGIELGTVWTRAGHVCCASPISRRRRSSGGGRFELMPDR